MVSFEPTDIIAAVSHVGVTGSCPSVDEEFHGGECRVFKVSFKDEPSVAVRVRHSGDSSQNDTMISLVEMEVGTLQRLNANGFPWAPKCLGASSTFDNPISFPFIVLTWAEGLPLMWDDSHPQEPLRASLLCQIASIQLSLLQCTLQTGSITATAFFERRMDNILQRVRAGKIPGLSEKDCFDQQALLEQVLGGERDSTVFAMDHGDIKPANIIVDEHYNITCLIDWGGFVATVPIAKASALPRFLWSTDFATLTPSETILRDRQTYTHYLLGQGSPSALSMLRWQTGVGVDFRTLYLESTFSKGMHMSMARVGWKIEGGSSGHEDRHGSLATHGYQ